MNNILYFCLLIVVTCFILFILPIISKFFGCKMVKGNTNKHPSCHQKKYVPKPGKPVKDD